jgi:hypothetical protein
MNRYLRTRVKSIHDVKSMVETKADVAPKLRARELRLNGGKRNRLKENRHECRFTQDMPCAYK